VGAQTTHQLGWGNTGSDANQELTIEVGDTVEWTWGTGTHNLIATSGTETFDSGYHGSPGYVFSYTFNQVGATNYVCSPHAGNMYGTITVTEENGCPNPTITQWTMSGDSV
jgi:plastocyanin